MRRNVNMRVLGSIHEDGAKLIEMSPQSVSDLRAEMPGMRIVPVVYYSPALTPRPTPASGPQAAAKAAGTKITVKVVSQKDGSPVAGAMVVAFTDFAERIGAQGKTNAKGEAGLALGAAKKKLERLYIFPKINFWGALKKNLTISSGQVFQLTPVDLGFTDALRFFYGSSPNQAGLGLTVGVIDTGIAAHPDLVIDGGLNTVHGEKPEDFGDNGEGHGTHVAGIIAARGLPPTGIRGLAPGVKLRSYRVFGKGQSGASNFAIAMAIDRAVADGCDLINMSLGGGAPDAVTQEAISDARASGAVVIVAAGNDDRSPVSFPASDSMALAVSAMGRKGTFPRGSTETGDVAAPFGKPDKMNFIASFSNVGPDLDLTAPGVGILSTFPGGYAPLDGTSMACPAVTGAAARLLSGPGHAATLAMSRDQARSDQMVQIILQAAQSLGFGPTFEGQGEILLS
jgi:subtilisin